MNNILNNKKVKLVLLFTVLLIGIVLIYNRTTKILDTSKLTPTEFDEKYSK